MIFDSSNLSFPCFFSHTTSPLLLHFYFGKVGGSNRIERNRERRPLWWAISDLPGKKKEKRRRSGGSVKNSHTTTAGSWSLAIN